MVHVVFIGQQLGAGRIFIDVNGVNADAFEHGYQPSCRDAVEQAKGIGRQQRFVIGAGSPTTRETGPERLRKYGEFMQKELARISPSRG